MAHETIRLGPGKLYKMNEDGSADCLGEVKLEVMPREEYLRLRIACPYKGCGYAGDDHTMLTEHCNHPKNRPEGHSWGECDWLQCPLNRDV